MINNNNRQFTLNDFYTFQSIEQYTDKLANQTSFCLHFHNAYSLAQCFQVTQINNLKCNYCKGFYFPSLGDKKNNDSVQHKKQTLKKIIQANEQAKTFVCGLCGSINDIKADNFSNIFPKFHEITVKQKDFHYNSHFQSVIASQTKTSKIATKIKPLIKEVENEIIFVFCIDLEMLSQNIQLNNLTYFKTVVMEFFSRHIENIQSKNLLKQQDEQTNVLRQKQNYLILLTFSINGQLFVADLNTISTICVETLLKQRVFAIVPSENTQQMFEKENQRKQNLIQLLHKSSLKMDSQESVQRFQQYMDMLIDQRDQTSNKTKLFVNGSVNFTKLMQLLSFDKSSCHSYVVSWISSTPVLNYEPHRVKKSNIYSLAYLFYQELNDKQKKDTSKSFLGQSKFQQSNVRNELLLIRDNHQIKFINVSQHQEGHQFYYLLYELFSIVDSPKIFRPRWTIKTDSKYPPILTNQPPSFFIKNPAMLYFIISSLIDKGGHSKFQVSVQFQDWKKDEHIWIINWTKDSQKQSQQLKGNSHKQIQLIPKMPQIYNYVHILIKFMMNVAIRGKNDIAEGKRQLMSLNTVTGHQFSVIIESIINHGVFRSNNIEIGVEYLSKLYEYLIQFKAIPFEVLKFLSCCQYNIRRAISILFPLVISSFKEDDSNIQSLVYWSSGYWINNDNGESQRDLQEGTISAISQHEGKFFTRKFLFKDDRAPFQNNEQFITVRYLTKAKFLKPQSEQNNPQSQQDFSFQKHQNQNWNQTQAKNKNYLIQDSTLTSSINLCFRNDTEQHFY